MKVRLGAFESPAWLPRRPGAAAAALALNAGLGAALILCFRVPIVLDSRDAVATLTWMSEPDARPKRAERRESNARRSIASHSRASDRTLSSVVPSVVPITVTPARVPIDWWKEAERVVRDRTRATPTLPDGSRIDLHIESRADVPAHHAGESYRDESGDHIVWVSDKCYIESDPPLPGTPPVFAGARGTRTICPGNSNVPRGDLFKDLPAYRKYGSESR